MDWYPGCSLEGTAREYGASMREACRLLGHELTELPDWSCCGAGVAGGTDAVLSRALPLRNVALAAARGEELLVPCAACYNRLRRAQVELVEGQPQAAAAGRRVERATGRSPGAPLRILHPLRWWSEPETLAELGRRAVRPWGRLPLAAYYGCLLLRPAAVALDDPEQPRRMEAILTAVGARPVAWPGRTECCGAGLGLAAPEAVRRRVRQLAEAARAAGARAMVTACPMCQGNLDAYQEAPGLPVLFLSEVVAGALGADLKPFLRRHLIDSAEVADLAG